MQIEYYKLPPDVKDDQLVSDHFGNIYQYNQEQDSWLNLGIEIITDTVDEKADGLVDPPLFKLIQKIKSLITGGIDFRKTKIYIGDHKNNPYFYYFHSTNGTIRFIPFRDLDGLVKLQVEVNRQFILTYLTKLSCGGPTGPKGIQGSPGSDGKAAEKERFLPPIDIQPQSMHVRSRVDTPIETDISLRVFEDKSLLFELLLDIKLQALTVIGNSDKFVVDDKQTKLNYNKPTNILTGIIVLSKGQFINDPFRFHYKVRQRGPKGQAGENGKQFLELIDHFIEDPIIEFTSFIAQLRQDGATENIFFSESVIPDVPTASTMKLKGSVPAGEFLLAVEPTTARFKKVVYYKFEDDVSIPSLKIPEWRPYKSCMNNGKHPIVNFNWRDQITVKPEVCFDLSIPFDIRIEPSGGAPTCCKEDLFICSNLGDACAIESKNMSAAVPPLPHRLKQACATQPTASSPSSSSSASSSSSSQLGSSSSTHNDFDIEAGDDGAGTDPEPESSSSSSSSSSSRTFDCEPPPVPSPIPVVRKLPASFKVNP